MLKVISINDIKEISTIAYDFVTNYDLLDLPEGRYDLCDGIYVNVESYETKLKENSRYESHRKYVDVQIVVSGSEIISVQHCDALNVVEKYDNFRDITFYANDVPSTDYILKAGQCLMLFPSEGHMPCVRTNANKPESVKKAVIKIPITEFKNIKYLVMDVDGTLTDGKIYMGNEGEVCKAFNIKDGCGIHDILIPAGVTPIIITGRSSKIVENRCKELGIEELYQSIGDKGEKLDKLLKDKVTNYSNVAYIGDDINDLPCMIKIKENGGLTSCPADAVQRVKDIADFICTAKGGEGAAREFIEWIINNSSFALKKL